jgi:hypothetical protein
MTARRCARRDAAVELVDGEYREAAQSVDGVLRSTQPWPFETDLRPLARR